jgi:uracil-DNA glycosylase family 4
MTQPSSKSLAAVAKAVETCTECPLGSTRLRVVPGMGSSNANLLFIGEAPGYNEDQQGVPFVGAAGKLLDSLLAEISLSRSDIFITNMVKCRPPDNRDPLLKEINACSQYLEKQIAIISPQIIVTLGRHAFAQFFPGESIMQARGKIRSFRQLKIFPVLHPAAALYRGDLRNVLKEDFARLRKLLDEFDVSVSGSLSEESKPDQLAMF